MHTRKEKKMQGGVGERKKDGKAETSMGKDVLISCEARNQVRFKNILQYHSHLCGSLHGLQKTKEFHSVSGPIGAESYQLFPYLRHQSHRLPCKCQKCQAHSQAHISGTTFSGQLRTLGSVPWHQQRLWLTRLALHHWDLQQEILCNSIRYIIWPINKTLLFFPLRINSVLSRQRGISVLKVRWSPRSQTQRSGKSQPPWLKV